MRPDLRLAGFYALIFGAFGVSLPYWPLWLAARGLDPRQIGLVFALTALAKILATPVMTALADRLDRRRAVILCLLGASLVANLCFLAARGWAAILAISFFAVLVTSPVMSLTDALALALARDGRLDYGRVRLFGSLGFMLVALAAGFVIEGRPADLILWLVIALMSTAFVAALLLPEIRERGEAGPRLSLAGQLAGMAALVARREVAWFLLAAGLIQNSHLAYYGFSALYWRSAGIGSGAIGWLWAEGVIAEILLFAVGPSLLRRLGPERLILLGGLGGVLRWTVLGLSTELVLLAAAQLLHALSFAAAHLGAMLYLARHAPSGLGASAQGLYAALPLGIGTGLVYGATGVLFEHYGGSIAFLAMAALAALGTLAMGCAMGWRGRIRAM